MPRRARSRPTYMLTRARARRAERSRAPSGCSTICPFLQGGQVRIAAVTRLAMTVASAAALAAVAGVGRATAPTAAPCIEPAQPAWIDYGDKWVPFRQVFFRPGLAVALAHDAARPQGCSRRRYESPAAPRP